MPRAGLSPDAVVDAALALLDEQGVEPAFAAVAAKAGVAPPSLYKHVRSAADLRSLVGQRILGEFGDKLGGAVMGRSGDDAETALMLAWRGYVRDHPHRYTMMSLQPLTDPALAETGRRLLQAIIAVLSGYGLTGTEAVHAARRLRAAAHGFTVLEAQGGFGLPQEIDASYDLVIAMVITSLRA